MRRCSLCGGTTVKKLIKMSFFNNSIQVNPVKADVCTICGEKFIASQEVGRIQSKVNAIKKAMQKQHIKKVEIVI